ncbi:MAG TPA: GFA family protein [Gammaproteobacteria bacterium]|jgi:hypothetical protein
MITASCHCGRVTLEIDTAPTEVTDCTCSICCRYGVLWAYYSPEQVRTTGETESYMWGAKSIAFHRCGECGCVTHWAPAHPDRDPNRMGVNARLMPLEVLGKTRVRHLDGAVTERYID